MLPPRPTRVGNPRKDVHGLASTATAHELQAHFLWQRFLDDKCFETAGALSYTTLVSLVPLMVAILAMFSVFPVLVSKAQRDTLINFVFRNFVPAAGEHVQMRCRTLRTMPASSPASACW
jgi:uncharacterized BrkB/YihY/UPF0761 family membrane protein